MKNSRKKLWMSIAGIVLSIVLLGMTALAATENIAGYNRFKELVIDSAFSTGMELEEIKSATITAAATIQRDQTEIMNVSAVVKSHTEGEVNYTSNIVTVKSGLGEKVQESWTETSKEGSTLVTRDFGEERYSVGTYNFSEMGIPIEDFEVDVETYELGSSRTPAQERLLNALIDLVAGDTKSHFRSDNDTISVNLEGAQIPEIAQLLLSVVEEENRGQNYLHKSDSAVVIEQCIGDLKDLRFELIRAEIGFINGEPWNARIDAMMSGMDINGVKHTLKVEGTVEQSDVGSTVADKIDLDEISDLVDIDPIGNGMTLTASTRGIGFTNAEMVFVVNEDEAAIK